MIDNLFAFWPVDICKILGRHHCRWRALRPTLKQIYHFLQRGFFYLPLPAMTLWGPVTSERLLNTKGAAITYSNFLDLMRFGCKLKTFCFWGKHYTDCVTTVVYKQDQLHVWPCITHTCDGQINRRTWEWTDGVEQLMDLLSSSVTQ
jgi:hypothetical protein